MKVRTALLSVSDKTGLVDLGERLHQMGVELISTGGTARLLNEADIPATPVSEVTGFPEILDGRVKTLHPQIHAGILARHDDAEHQRTLEVNKIQPLGLVVVNLYPFGRTIQQGEVSLEEALEQVDIGGVTLIRAAAKNFKHVTVVVDPADYEAVINEMRANRNQTLESTRQQLARKAFHHTTAYDAVIASYLDNCAGDIEELPKTITLSLLRVSSLRYGENPHQRASLYRTCHLSPHGLVAGNKLQGKDLSFNNYLDLDAAWNLCREFESPFCGIIKHTNPCGAATASTLCGAYQRALACDPVSAFGSVISFNKQVDSETAEHLDSLFVEAIIAPSYEREALEKFSRKKNLRLIEMGPQAPSQHRAGLRTISGGFLMQGGDNLTVTEKDFRTVTHRTPNPTEMRDLLFAWNVCKHVKSNGIVLVRQGQTMGLGVGQMSRLDSVRLATQKSQVELNGAVMASDAFFPFPDAVKVAAQAGISAVIQPGGSIRDDQVVEMANQYGLAMVFTGVRHFRH